MSGGGGSTPWTNSPEADCLTVYKDLSLMSPVPEVVKTLKVGNVLDFYVYEEEGRKSLRMLFKGEVAGAITRHAPKIISCIEKGHEYNAVVTGLDGGSCTLEARMKE